MTAASAAELLERPIAVGGRSKPFAELSLAEVEAHAELLRGATGFGHGGRVAGVASAWRRLATLMRERGAATPAELSPDEVVGMAEALWIEPPGGSILP